MSNEAWESRCRDCDDTGITIQTERRCTCQAPTPIPDEAEGLIKKLRSRADAPDVLARQGRDGLARYDAKIDRDAADLIERLTATVAEAVERERFVTMWRKTGKECLDWDFHVSDFRDDAERVVANIQKQGVYQWSTYTLGKRVTELSDEGATAIRTSNGVKHDPA